MGAAAKGGKPAVKPVARSGAGRGQGAMLWWGGLGCGAMVVLSPASAVLLLALIVPVLPVALLPEDGPGGRVVRAALLFGLAASIHPLALLWQTDATLSAAMGIVRQPLTLLTAWVAVGAGWFTGEFASTVLKLAADISAASQRRSIAASLAALEEEWGPLFPPDGPAAP